MSRALALSRAYPSRYGTPIIRRVDPAIFTLRYFTHCLACTFCGDACCDHGVDVDLVHRDAILARADRLEAFSGIPRDRWFTTRIERDEGYPGGGAVRTRVRNGHCVFLARPGRGCRLHAFCLSEGLDYHDLKSLVDVLFPLTFADDLLCPAEELEDHSLICGDQGPTAYQGLRDELGYYFGSGLVAECDEFDAGIRAAGSGPDTGARRVPAPHRARRRSAS